MQWNAKNSDGEDSLLHLYRTAGEMEATLRSIVQQDAQALLTEAQTSEYNHLIEAAREVLPRSVGLREDVGTVDADDGITAADAYRALHVTVVPLIHYALPDGQYTTA